MRSIRRWSLVVAGVAVLASLPWMVAHRPVPSSSIAAPQLLRLIQNSGSVGYSGYAESVGGLAVPVTDQVSSVADLLGGRTQLRVWWRGPLDWRVDTVGAFGESDISRDQAGTWTWEYERLRATRTAVGTDVAVRLPQAADLLPPELGRRLLGEATSAEVTRLPAMWVAGSAAAGLRLRPAQPQSSIDRVDVWADPSSGVPLRVDVYGRESANPAVTTAFLDYGGSRPSASETGFVPPASVRVHTGSALDLVSATDSFAGAEPPASLAGIARSSRAKTFGSVGVYGRGVTELVATPLRGRFAGALRRQLVGAPGVIVDGSRTQLAVGPLNLLLLSSADRRAWLLSGTVTAQTLRTAADGLAAIPPGGGR